MADTNTYSYSDIQRYLQQKMSQQEMHEFEKTLMNDPFLADALEGYVSSNEQLANADLKEVQTAILHREQKGTRVSIGFNKASWWKIAAMLLLVVLAGVITYSVTRNSTQEKTGQIAKTEPKQSVADNDHITPIERPNAQITKPVLRTNIIPRTSSSTSTNGKTNRSSITASNVQKKDKEAIRVERDLASASQLAMKQTKDESLLVQNAAESRSLVTASIVRAESRKQARLINEKTAMISSMTGITKEFKGKVVDKLGQPIPYADIQVETNGLSTTADKNGNFNLKTSDSIVNVSISYPGYVTTKTALKDFNSVTKILLNEEELSLSEMVVSELAKKKRSKISSISIDTTIAAEPIGGWSKFNQYLNREIDSLHSIDKNLSFDGELSFEFFTNQVGQAINIKVRSDTDQQLAEKLKVILANGPHWNNKKTDKKVKLIISF